MVYICHQIQHSQLKEKCQELGNMRKESTVLSVLMLIPTRITCAHLGGVNPLESLIPPLTNLHTAPQFRKSPALA